MEGHELLKIILSASLGLGTFWVLAKKFGSSCIP